MAERLIKQKRTYKEIFVDAGFVGASAAVLKDQEKKLPTFDESESSPGETLSRNENCAKLCRQVCHTTTLMIEGQEQFSINSQEWAARLVVIQQKSVQTTIDG